MDNQIVIIEMIKSVSAVIKNVRFWLLVCTVSSGLTFISTYNTNDGGWFTLRAKKQQVLNELKLTHDTSSDSTKSLCEIVDSEIKKINLNHGSKTFKYRVLKWLTSENDEDIPRCQELSFEQIGKTGSFWSDRRSNAIYTTTVPWLGLHFDINDLGLISGFFLSIFLLLLLYQFGLRYSNLDKLFSVISKLEEPADKKLYYELSTFSIILKLPRSHSKESRFSLLVIIPYLFFFLPTAVYGYLFIKDFTTYKHVIDLYPNIVLNVVFEAVFLLIISYINFNIYKLDKATDKLWDEYELKLTAPSQE